MPQEIGSMVLEGINISSVNLYRLHSGVITARNSYAGINKKLSEIGTPEFHRTEIYYNNKKSRKKSHSYTRKIARTMQTEKN